ncbi:MAG: hypothetical protein AVO35_05265 [Candidatus Aegiribacteria sp. MLS_C]|nr:MAG: hypothetical protein AVO35_05265 [Candidatus Aegiribacteria sp. MLS_C]
MQRVDMHIHSTASDGVLAPAEIAGLAAERSLYMFSITDHDTLDGIMEGSARAASSEAYFVPGIEFSVEVDAGDGFSAHLLGYFPGAGESELVRSDTPLGEAISYVQGGRVRRNPRILDRLRENGVYIQMTDVAALADGEVVGRPHIAQAMVDAGYVGSMREAFNRFLAKGRPAYVDRDRLPVRQAMEVIRSSGGLPVMAHPGYIALDSDGLRDLFRTLKDHGLAGIEVYYPAHSGELVSSLLAIAEDFDLFATGGTDFHGRLEDAEPLGGSGNFCVDMEKVRYFVDLCRDRIRR